jgi:hypothetical protein
VLGSPQGQKRVASRRASDLVQYQSRVGSAFGNRTKSSASAHDAERLVRTRSLAEAVRLAYTMLCNRHVEHDACRRIIVLGADSSMLRCDLNIAQTAVQRAIPVDRRATAQPVHRLHDMPARIS